MINSSFLRHPLIGTLWEKSTCLFTGSIAKSATKACWISELSPFIAVLAFSAVQIRGVLRSSAQVARMAN